MSRKSRYLEPLAVAVAGGESVRRASESAGCCESTGYRICRSPEFRQRVGEIRTDATDAAVGRLSWLAVDAVEVLRDVMQDANNPPVSRVGAAKTLLATLGPLSELHELRSRLDGLEAMQIGMEVAK